MAKTPTLESYQEMVRGALRDIGRYVPAMEMQIFTLSTTLLTLYTATMDIHSLKRDERWCGSAKKMHPAFNVQRYAWDSITRQMKALGLNAEALGGEVEGDPLADLTSKLIAIGGAGDDVIRPPMEAGDE